MKRKHHNMLLLAGLGAAAYYFYTKSHAPAVVVAGPNIAAATPGVAGFGYFPSGSDRPFARTAYGQPANMPFARFSHGIRHY